MTDFEKIRLQYERSFELHGDSPASLLCPKGNQHLRFRAIDEFVNKGRRSVLDYGCGLGHLLEYLEHERRQVEYVGVDIVPAFVDACKAKFGDRGHFELIDPVESLPQRYDIVFASGVFNMRTGSEVAAKEYVYGKLKVLFEATKDVLVCDFLSDFVDFKQDNALHFSIGEICSFCVARLSRRFVIRHDLRPYEFTLIAYKDDIIARPDNIFQVHAK